MNRKQKIIISVTGIFIVLLILVGLTYAYFLTRIQGNTNTKSISVTTADLKLTYGDGNGDITAEKIQPGTTIDIKTFTVKNEGNATVNNYAVYLEELVNTLSRTSDMVYTLTCTSSVSGKTCNGVNETTFPTQNGLLVTNNIDVNETQSYELKVVYKEMNIDQSEDMNKTIGAKVQIYNLRDIVDITGTVTGTSNGDYVELHSNPKKSQINNDTYTIPGVEPGNHTIYLKDKDGNVLGQKDITINKGETAGVSGTTITTTEDSQTVTINLTKTSSDFTIELGKIGKYNPFEKGTLAYEIINDLGYISEPLSSPGNSVSGTKFKENGFSPETAVTIGEITNDEKVHMTYADSYTFDPKTGYSLKNPKDGKYTEIYSKLKGKYIVSKTDLWSEGSNLRVTDNLEKIYRVINATLNKLELEVKNSTIERFSEGSLVSEPDDYGTSYYFRGSNTQMITFNNMCWLVSRIEGDGSVKLILDDYGYKCSSKVNSGNYAYAQARYGSTDATLNSYIKKNTLFNPENDPEISMINILKKFETEKLSKVKDRLKVDNWCVDNVVYSDKKGTSLIEKANSIYDGKTVTAYYDTYIRLRGLQNRQPSLKCKGVKHNKYADGSDMYVGALTADELVFAGLKSQTEAFTDWEGNGFYFWSGSPTMYTNINNGTASFWTLSPWMFLQSSSYWADTAVYVNEKGSLEKDSVHSKKTVRPSIVLKKDVKFERAPVSEYGARDADFIIK